MKQTVQQLFKDGKKQVEICRLTKIPKSTVSRWVNETLTFVDKQRTKLKNTSILSKIEARYITEPNSGCWIWLGNIKKNGYGSLTIKTKNYYAHRLAYELMVGSIPNNLVLDHKCRNKCCCNPDHLEPVTTSENIKRGHRWKGKEKQ